MDQQQPPPQQPQQPQWSPPPQQPQGWGGPGYGGAPVRPTSVTLSAIYLIVMGILVGLVGGCAAAGGALIGSADSNVPGLGGVGAAVGVFGIIILIIGILQIAAGAGSLTGAGWARWTGIIVSIIFAILLILGGLGSLTGSNGVGSGIVSLVLGVVYALVAWVFIQASAYFSMRR